VGLDWKSLPNGTKKRHAYYASREWALKRNAVRTRANGKCERCGSDESCQVHHLSYQHLYNEPLEELQLVCENCHQFESGKSDVDPAAAIDYELRHFFILETNPLVESVKKLLKDESDQSVFGLGVYFSELLEIVYPNSMQNGNWYSTVMPQHQCKPEDDDPCLIHPVEVGIWQFNDGPAVFICDSPIRGFDSIKARVYFKNDVLVVKDWERNGELVVTRRMS